MKRPRGWKGLQTPPLDIMETNQRCRDAGRPSEGWYRARVNLPPLTTMEAVVLLDVLDRMSRAVWKANGDGIAEYMASVETDSGTGTARPKASALSPVGDPTPDDF